MKKLFAAAACLLSTSAWAAFPNAVFLNCPGIGSFVVEYSEAKPASSGGATLYPYPELEPIYRGKTTPTNINVEARVGENRNSQITVDRFDGQMVRKLWADNDTRVLETNSAMCSVMQRRF